MQTTEEIQRGLRAQEALVRAQKEVATATLLAAREVVDAIHFMAYGGYITLCGIDWRDNRTIETTERRILTTCVGCRDKFRG